LTRTHITTKLLVKITMKQKLNVSEQTIYNCVILLLFPFTALVMIGAAVVSWDIYLLFPCFIILNSMITVGLGAFRALFSVMHAEAFIE
jgi:hypothetical protein